MDITEVTTMLGTLLGVLTPLGGVGAWQYRRLNRRLKESETKLAEINVEKAGLDFEKERVNHLHEIIENYNKTEVEHSQRISELNHALNAKEDELRDKTVQMRLYVGEAIKAENEVNRVNDMLIEAQKEIAELKVELEKKRCDDLPCPFRMPPNAHTRPKAAGQTREEYAKGRDINLNKE